MCPFERPNINGWLEHINMWPWVWTQRLILKGTSASARRRDRGQWCVYLRQGGKVEGAKPKHNFQDQAGRHRQTAWCALNSCIDWLIFCLGYAIIGKQQQSSKQNKEKQINKQINKPVLKTMPPQQCDTKLSQWVTWQYFNIYTWNDIYTYPFNFWH